jgi:hypothetical protein
VSLRFGFVLAHLQRRDEAAEVLRLAHALDRGRLVTAAEFSPDAVAVFEAAIAATPPPATVTVQATARAELTSDGEAVGRAPLTLPLGVGQHVVIARAPGRIARGEAILVGATTRSVELSLDAAPGSGALVAGAGEAAAGAAVAEILEYGELDALYVVASVYRGGGPALLGQRCELARPACTAIVEIGHVDGGLEAAARALLEQLDRASRRYGVLLSTDVRVARGERGRPDGDGRCRWCRDPKVLVGGGLVLAGLITVAALALTGDDPVPVVTFDPDDFTR